MRISRAGEFAAIERIRKLCRKPGREVVSGIGDDAAAYKPGAGLVTLVSTDMLVEGVHFDLAYTGYWELGYKALAANISDIAAMGGSPRYYLVSIALRPDFRVEDLDSFYKGMEAMAEGFGVYAIGGDTCAASGPIVISVTILGEADGKKIVIRKGARPGDDIYVTGTLGDSAGGLDLLKSEAVKFADFYPAMRRPQSDRDTARSYLVARHLMPSPRVEAGRMLAENGLATAMIDISDGFSSDLAHILDESGVGAEIEQDSLPISSELLSVFGKKKAVKLALHGGEDYELLFTAKRRARKAIEALDGCTAFTRVGRVTPGKGVFLITAKGGRRPLAPKGYEHFRG